MYRRLVRVVRGSQPVEDSSEWWGGAGPFLQTIRNLTDYPNIRGHGSSFG